MAVLARSLHSSGPSGWAKLACALGLVLSCSGTAQAPPIESAPEAEPPPIRPVPRVELEVTWSVGVDQAPEAPDERLLYLVPTSPIDGFDTDADLQRASSWGVPDLPSVPEYSVRVTWPIGAVTVKAVPAPSLCDRLPDYATWRSVEIRGVEGCEFTNEAGLYFLRWVEGGTSFHYSSFTTTGAEARKMLADWDPLEQPPG